MAPTEPDVIQRRLRRERRTIEAMIDIYCRGRHDTTGTRCTACEELRTYAFQRIEKCPYGEDKPTCARCPIHCYKPDRREEVRTVMRFSGPRMLLHHPILTLLHYVDEFTRDPPDGKTPKHPGT